MSYCIEYVLDIPGRDFSRILDSRYIPSEDEFQMIERELDPSWDARLHDGSDVFGVDLYGQLTRATLRHAYSGLVTQRPDIVAVVGEWENKIIDLLPKIAILRCDELLLEYWLNETDDGESWICNRSNFAKLLEWLPSQASSNWIIVQSRS